MSGTKKAGRPNPIPIIDMMIAPSRLTKPAQSIAIWLAPFILERTDFVTRSPNMGEIFLDQPDSAIMGIKIFTGVIPGAACLLGALILIWYPLRGDRLEKIQDKILHLHYQKKQQLEERLKETQG